MRFSGLVRPLSRMCKAWAMKGLREQVVSELRSVFRGWTSSCSPRTTHVLKRVRLGPQKLQKIVGRVRVDSVDRGASRQGQGFRSGERSSESM